jgi:hypothetical protein
MDDDFGRFGCVRRAKKFESLAVGSERWVVAVVEVVVCALLAGLARSFQDPAARYFMALRGSQVTCRLFVSWSRFLFRSVFFLKCHGGP